MLEAKNMLCARALLRMQLDTVTRLLAYTYVKNPDSVARAVIGGTPLKKFRSVEGRSLNDAYLVDRMATSHPWARRVYDFTSGYVHFSERQFFDSIHHLGSDEERTFQLRVGAIDNHYPQRSYDEVARCFDELLSVLEEASAKIVARKEDRGMV